MRNNSRDSRDMKLGGSRPSYLKGGTRSLSPTKEKMQPQNDKREAVSSEDKELASWTVWLFPRRPLVSLLVVLVLVCSLSLAYWALPSPIFLLVMTGLLINRLAAYLFPARYFLREKTVGYKTFLAKDVREWERFFVYQEFPDGVLLSLDTRTIRGRIREGLFLYYNHDRSNKNEVLSIVSGKLKSSKGIVSSQDEPSQGGLVSAYRRIRRLRKK